MHLLGSFTPEESDSLWNEDYRKIEEQVLASLGLENHRRISVIHDDTGYQRMHIAVDHLDGQGKLRCARKIFRRFMNTCWKISVERAWQAQ